MNLEGSSENPGAKAYIKKGMKICVNDMKPKRMRIITESTEDANSRALDFPSSETARPNKGMNAALNAPSAVKLRKKFGSFKATKKASATEPAPNKAAIRTSLRNPRIRLKNVSMLTVAIFLRNPMILDYFFVRCSAHL